MTNYASRFYPIPLQSFDSSTFTGDYEVLGTLTQPCRIIKFTNNSNLLVTISWDGTTDHEILPAASFVLLDGSANKQGDFAAGFQVGQSFWLKGADSGGSGLVYLSGYFTQ